MKRNKNQQVTDLRIIAVETRVKYFKESFELKLKCIKARVHYMVLANEYRKNLV